ncbi:hypothetical protein [Pseudomonas sp. Teo4]|uniref:hypothetical protein n=1 Tax=Pseudomonas sp. Teo4 TaxID=3064528 RepID=UPI002ABA253C|nr:hypothetical protein [Pseudomonas sp. Teo4]MDZ3990441.1 hypothetical protein [Pseudomonas sp. Teo4]
MIVSPFGILVSLYLTANFVSLVFGINDGGMLLEGRFFELPAEALVWSFLIQLLFMIFLWLLYRFFLRSPIVDLKLGSGSAWFLFITQVSFVAYNQVAGVNVAGVESHGGALGYIFFCCSLIFYFY